MIEAMSDERNVVVIGGFTEGKRVLEPVAEEAVRQGFGHDAGVLTLQAALKMPDKRLRRLLAGTTTVTHSLGLAAIPDARNRVSDRELPTHLVVVAGPEPRSIGDLAKTAVEKTVDHIFGQQTVYPRSSHLRIVASNMAEGLAHPIANHRLIAQASDFSTMARLGDGEAAASGLAGSFLMKDDEYFANPDWRQYTVLQNLQAEGWVVDELSGRHDMLLLDPYAVFHGVRHAFQQAAGQTPLTQ